MMQRPGPLTAETVYDLASVTKVIATTAACMILYDRGLFKLDQPLVELLPEFAESGTGQKDPRRQVTFRMLLAHSSGLPAYIKLFQTAHNKDELLAQALRRPAHSRSRLPRRIQRYRLYPSG